MKDFGKSFSFAVFSVLLFIVALITLVTYFFHNSSNSILALAAHFHVPLMVIALLVSIGYGFFWSHFLLGQVKTARLNSQQLWSIVFQLLSAEEKAVIDHLRSLDGKSTQAKISHVQNMGGVKAMRTVQKLEGKKLIRVQKEGKVRRVFLNASFIESV